MKSRQIVLGILLGGPKTGYDITMIFQTRFAFFFGSSTGMVYPTLRKLNKEGRVTKEVVLQTGKPNKKVYTITPDGEKEFYDYLSSPVEPTTIKSDFLARMYFGRFSDEQVNLERVRQEIQATQAKLDELLAYNKEAYNHQRMTETAELSFNYGIAQYKAEIAVLTEFLEKHAK